MIDHRFTLKKGSFQSAIAIPNQPPTTTRQISVPKRLLIQKHTFHWNCIGRSLIALADHRTTDLLQVILYTYQTRGKRHDFIATPATQT